ncbi:MAG TPA: DUF6285 domain-containing protein [Solirubrobacteraceae bacterium]|jgi:hypothetical protein|nr:DUF6285 domain-containing protein [Solirubrobacteraceae bacterium]
MQDRPDADELGAALARFLLEQVRPAVPRELRFQLLVAANTAAMLGREGAGGDAPGAERARLARLLPQTPDEARDAQGELARAIRAGELDDRWDEVAAVLRESVRAKLAVAHPGYDRLADDGRG